jgi:uncharacterized membrane protein
MKNKLNWLQGALILGPAIALLALYNDLPERVPMHWNLHGQIDGWASKPFIFFMPLVSLFTVGLLHFLPRIDPKLRGAPESQGRMPNTLAILRLALAAFFAAILFMQLAAALGHPVPASRIVPASVLLLLVVFGNYLSNLRPNYFAGIRTPWTLESPATWRATHRLGGRLLFFGAITLLVLEFFLSESLFLILFMSSVVLLVVWAFWYSWRHYHTQGEMRLPSARGESAHTRL